MIGCLTPSSSVRGVLIFGVEAIVLVLFYILWTALLAMLIAEKGSAPWYILRMEFVGLNFTGDLA